MPLDYRKEALKHIGRLEAYAKKIERAYEKANMELSRIALSVDHPVEDLFQLSDYPEIKERVDKVIQELHNNIETIVLNGEKVEWGYANNINDELAGIATGLTVTEGAKIAGHKRYFNQNEQALDAFQKRKNNGLNLSERVWNLTDQYKRDIELGLSVGIGDGRSAAQLSRDLRTYLNEPEKLFRRVRDQYGNLILSRNAQNYHPGQGVYRSSCKNAMRLTRTEINTAYRAADQTRWEQMDFVLGYKIARSNNPYPCPVCESLAGNYPKEFVWGGWHPQCRCVMTPILQEMGTFLEDEEQILNGDEPIESRKNMIRSTPKNFDEWVKKNEMRIAQAEYKGTTPYFLTDNPKYVDLSRYQLTRSEKAVIDYRKKYLSYDSSQWHKDYFNKKNGGYIVTDLQRIEHAGLSKNERAKFNKEMSMARIFAQNGYRMELQHEQNRACFYDVKINEAKADFKCAASHNNVVKYAKKAIRDQGADMVLFQFDNETDALYKELAALKREGIKGYYFFTGREDQIFKL